MTKTVDEKNYIKLYKPLCYVKLKSGDIYFTDAVNKKQLINDANDSKLNLIMIEGKAVARFDIVEIDDYNTEESDVKMFIATRPAPERRALIKRDEQKYSRVGKGIQTVQEASVWLERWRL